MFNKSELKALETQRTESIKHLDVIDTSTDDGKKEYAATIQTIKQLEAIISDDEEKKRAYTLKRKNLELEALKEKNNHEIELAKIANDKEKIVIDKEKNMMSFNELTFNKERFNKEIELKRAELEAQKKELKMKVITSLFGLAPSIATTTFNAVALKTYSSKADQSMALEYIDCGKTPNDFRDATKNIQNLIKK